MTITRKHPLAEVPLTNSDLVAVIDADLIDKILCRKWYLTPDGYVKSTDHRGERFLHRVVCPTNEVDHINGNPLDNRLSNLRDGSNGVNGHNKAGQGSSSYKGVYWNERERNWKAQITLHYRTTHLGTFDSEEDAAVELRGEDARTNF